MSPLSIDVRDRVVYVVSISLGLGALFDESVDAENDWLNLPREGLNHESPLMYMLKGHMVNLMTVVEMVEHERGL